MHAFTRIADASLQSMSTHPGRGVEDHLPGMAPTSLADPGLVGTGDDAGDVA